MPILELTAEAIGPGRTHLTTDYIAAVMLWPNDPERRDEAMRTSAADFTRSALGQIDADDPAAKLEPALRDGYYDLMLSAMPAEHIHKAAWPAFRNGMMVGELLCNAVEMALANNGQLKLESVKEAMVANRRRATHKSLDISRATLENSVCGAYKQVAHLWGAYFDAAKVDGERAFPCQRYRLLHFLAFARFLLRTGRTTPLSKNQGRLLSGDAWDLPATVPLPLHYAL